MEHRDESEQEENDRTESTLGELSQEPSARFADIRLEDQRNAGMLDTSPSVGTVSGLHASPTQSYHSLLKQEVPGLYEQN